jgi:Mandelate racemase / muconate lactonizing enzyme, N-terminal domain
MEPPRLSLRSVRATPVDVPMARPLGTSVQTIRTAPLLLIDLETEEGITGRSYLFCYLKAAAAPIMRMLEDALESVTPDTAKLVLTLNRLGTDREDPVVASMYRHLAHGRPISRSLGRLSLLSRRMGGCTGQPRRCWTMRAGVPDG